MKQLQRILRFLAAIPAIKEVGAGLFTANKLTKTLTVPSLAAGLVHNMISMNPAWAALPAYLENNKYQSPIDGANCPFQLGHNTAEHLFEWFPKHPANHEAFDLWVRNVSLLNAYPGAELLTSKSLTDDRTARGPRPLA